MSLSRDEYIQLAIAAQKHEPLIGLLNNLGHGEWMVCPECGWEEFMHAGDCVVSRGVQYAIFREAEQWRGEHERGE